MPIGMINENSTNKPKPSNLLHVHTFYMAWLIHFLSTKN